MPWKTFLAAHWDGLAAADFFTAEVLTMAGLIQQGVRCHDRRELVQEAPKISSVILGFVGLFGNLPVSFWRFGVELGLSLAKVSSFFKSCSFDSQATIYRITFATMVLLHGKDALDSRRAKSTKKGERVRHAR